MTAPIDFGLKACRIEASSRGADIIIEPDLSGIGFADFHLAEESIRRGQQAAADAIPRIKRLLAA